MSREHPHSPERREAEITRDIARLASDIFLRREDIVARTLGKERYQRAKRAEQERMERTAQAVLDAIEGDDELHAIETPRQPLDEDLKEYLELYHYQTAREREFADYAVLCEDTLVLPDEPYRTAGGERHLRSVSIEIGEDGLRRFVTSSEDQDNEGFFAQVEAGVQGEWIARDEMERIFKQLEAVEAMQRKTIESLRSAH